MMVKQVAPCNPLSVSYSLLDVSARPRGGTTGVQVSWILLRFCFLAHRGQRTERFSETKIQINIEERPWLGMFNIAPRYAPSGYLLGVPEYLFCTP